MQNKLLEMTIALIVVWGLAFAQDGKMIQERWNCYFGGRPTGDYIILTANGKFEKATVDIGNLYFGKYVIENDTLVLYADSAKYLEGFSKSIFKYKVSGDTLKLLSVRYGLAKVKTHFDPSLHYLRDRSHQKHP